MSDAETKTIGGKCSEISEKNGWTSFSIDVGSQYPVRLSTKLPALIEQGRAVGQEYAYWTFKESQGGENPNKPGTFYTNRYFESVTTDPSGAADVAASSSGTPRPQAQAASSAPTHAPLPPGDKDRAITRMAVLKAAAEACSGIEYAPGEDAAAVVIAMAERFERWVYRDTDEIPFG